MTHDRAMARVWLRRSTGDQDALHAVAAAFDHSRRSRARADAPGRYRKIDRSGPGDDGGGHEQRGDHPGLSRSDRGDGPDRADAPRGDRDQPRCDRAGARCRCAAQGRQAARAARRRAGADQGQYRDQGSDRDDRGEPRAQKQHHAPRRAAGGEPAPTGRGDPRQDQSQRMGQYPLDALDERMERRRRAGAQSLRARPDLVRILERIGRGGGGELCRGSGRDRDRWIGGVSVLDERAGRVETDARHDQPHARRADQP